MALVTFGDPISVWNDTITFPALPETAKALTYCDMTTPDPLCTNPVEDFPHSPTQFLEKLKDIWNDFSQADLNDEQKAALKSLVGELLDQASSKIGKLGEDIIAGHIRRWMLTPQHFLYGLGPHPAVEQAADDVLAAFRS